MTIPKQSREEAQAEILRQRYLCRTDLWYLLTEILEYKDLGQLHRDLIAEEARTRGKTTRRLYLLPRNHFKSTILTIGVTIQNILRSHGVDSTGEEYNTFLVSWSDDNSMTFVTEIRQHFELNRRLRLLFPDIIWEKPQSEARSKRFDWTDKALTVKSKRIRRIPTVLACSVESLPTGQHPDIVIADDMEVKANTQGDSSRRKLKENLAALGKLVPKPTQQRTFIGTYWHYDGIYTLLERQSKTAIDRQAAERYQLPVYKRSAIEDGKPIFPEMFTLDHLAALREEDPIDFEMQMQLNIAATSVDAVNPADLRYYDWKTEMPKRSDFRMVLMILDPARTVGKRSDYSALLVQGYHYDGRKFLLGGLYDKIHPERGVQEMKRLWEIWKPDMPVIVEKNGIELYMGAVFREQDFSDYIGIAVKGNKRDRIRKSLPAIRRNQFFLPKNFPVQIGWDGQPYDLADVYLDELMEFPNGRHDDMLDASATGDFMAGYEAPRRDDPAPVDTRSAMQRAIHEEIENLDQTIADQRSGPDDHIAGNFSMYW